ncbi:exodeoxyribonuclease V subunit alpha [Nocardioides sp.]|uniref:exodeoxyribonuclease V subunit alpha n=1 Tax=Nocardioides sp. TaxID=35761 RepID=UPI003D13667B
MSLLETDDRFDPRLVAGASGLLGVFNAALVIEAADVHVAQRLTALAGEPDETVALALALVVRALRGGSVCVDLATVADDPELAGLPWPDLETWSAAVAASPLLGTPPVLRLDASNLLYLDRYWREEEQVCADLVARPDAAPLDPVAEAALLAGLDRVFPESGYDEQRAAARVALAQRTTVLTGGPGTGKTTTVAALLALFAEQAELAGHPNPRMALAAPTGKAAARLQQAVEEELTKLPTVDQERVAGVRAVTLHRLLGSRPDSSSRFRHHRDNRLSYDVIVVDETSMVSLTMMARLLEAVRPEARLILVGDPDQLTSVEAGAVLSDLVDGLGSGSELQVAALRTSHRFGEAIGRLAEAVRQGDADAVVELLEAGDPHLEFVVSEEPEARVRELVLPHALDLRSVAEAGSVPDALAALDRQRLLCAHREGPFGVRRWNGLVERWLTEATGEPVWSSSYVGRPVLVTANDYGLGLYNGDTGVVCRSGDGSLRVAFATSGEPATFATSRLSELDTMHAMTIHKSQGSQADEVVILLPPQESRLLTRELFYTAVTRARDKVVVVGTEADVRAAVARRAQRATGLRQRLRGRGE